VSVTDPAKGFQALLRKLKVKPDPADAAASHAAAEPSDEARVTRARELLDLLIHSFMLWEATQRDAKAAVRRLDESFVDANELRIALPHESAKVLGDRYPLAAERCLRLRATLHDLYRREHRVTLLPLLAAPKREARAYLESLEGMPTFVAARLAVLGLGVHAVPVDWRLSDLLLAHKALPADYADPGAASSWLERHVRAGEAVAMTHALQSWSDDKGDSPKFDRSAAVAPMTLTEIPISRVPRVKPTKKAAKRPESKPRPRAR
jgi:hypothetical protein